MRETIQTLIIIKNFDVMDHSAEKKFFFKGKKISFETNACGATRDIHFDSLLAQTQWFEHNLIYLSKHYKS
jgi:hypothetical protein